MPLIDRLPDLHGSSKTSSKRLVTPWPSKTFPFLLLRSSLPLSYLSRIPETLESGAFAFSGVSEAWPRSESNSLTSPPSPASAHEPLREALPQLLCDYSHLSPLLSVALHMLAAVATGHSPFPLLPMLFSQLSPSVVPPRNCPFALDQNLVTPSSFLIHYMLSPPSSIFFLVFFSFSCLQASMGCLLTD